MSDKKIFECGCGKTYKTEKAFKKHLEKCPYKDLDKNKVLHIGNILNDVFKFFEPNGAEIMRLKRKFKDKNLSHDELKKIALNENILKYKKMLWDIYLVWKKGLLGTEFRDFVKWVKKSTQDLTLINAKKYLTNEKRIMKYSFQNSYKTIEDRILDSLDFIKDKEFENDFDFLEKIIEGHISIYFVIFNDYLATKWFERLDKDLQNELMKLIKEASYIIKNNITKSEFEKLNDLANSKNPIINNFDDDGELDDEILKEFGF